MGRLLIFGLIGCILCCPGPSWCSEVSETDSCLLYTVAVCPQMGWGAGIGRIFISFGTSTANHRLIHHFLVLEISETWEEITQRVSPCLAKEGKRWASRWAEWG